MRVYLAGPMQMRPQLRGCRDYLELANISITSRWLDTEVSDHNQITAEERRKWSQQDFEDIAMADIVVVWSILAWFNKGTGGRHVELGYAIGVGKPIILVGLRENLFHWHPRVLLIPNELELLKKLITVYNTYYGPEESER